VGEREERSSFRDVVDGREEGSSFGDVDSEYSIFRNGEGGEFMRQRL
jgi:hypothetical protein